MFITIINSLINFFFNFILFQSLEKFSGLTHQVSCSLDLFMRIIHDTEFPNSVEATQTLLDDQGADYDKLKVNYKLFLILKINIIYV